MKKIDFLKNIQARPHSAARLILIVLVALCALCVMIQGIDLLHTSHARTAVIRAEGTPSPQTALTHSKQDTSPVQTDVTHTANISPAQTNTSRAEDTSPAQTDASRAEDTTHAQTDGTPTYDANPDQTDVTCTEDEPVSRSLPASGAGNITDSERTGEADTSGTKNSTDLNPNPAGKNPDDTETTAIIPDKMDINQATAADLQRVSGIGPTLASRIIEQRQAQGGFHFLEEVKDVPGIGEKRFAAIQELFFCPLP